MARPRANDGEAGAGVEAASYPPPDVQQGAGAAPPVAPYPPQPMSSPVNPVMADAPAAPYPPPSPYPPPEEYPPAMGQPPQDYTPGPAPGPQPQEIGSPWSTGLFDCHEHQTNALMTAFFPCVTFGQIAEILDSGQTSCTMGSLMYVLSAPVLCLNSVLGSSYRKKMRERYNLVQAPAEDWILHLFCPCCSLCQEFRELMNRGIDPSLGYLGNLALQRGGTTMVPPQGQFMNP